MEESPFTSRKWILTHITFMVAALLPIGYHLLNISDTLTLAVLSVLTASKVSYDIANVAAKKSE